MPTAAFFTGYSGRFSLPAEKRADPGSIPVFEPNAQAVLAPLLQIKELRVMQRVGRSRYATAHPELECTMPNEIVAVMRRGTELFGNVLFTLAVLCICLLYTSDAADEL